MNPLFKLRNLLESAAEQNDTDVLHQCLSGRNLPVLGGNEQPADIILKALSVPSFDPELGNGLVVLLSDLIEEYTGKLEKGVSANMDQVEGATQTRFQGPPSVNLSDDEMYVYNLFLFASYLPRNPGLFQSLKNIYQTGLRLNVIIAGHGKAGRQLVQAIMFQQTDQSFEEKWMGYFQDVPPNTVQLSREQRGRLLDAWQGLLWVPPTAEERKADRTVSMDRINTGLSALYNAVSQTTDDVGIPRYAIRLLESSYPRSADFWVKGFSEYIHGSPGLLRDALINQWPKLGKGEFEDISTLLSNELQPIWELVSPEQQSEINEIISDLDHSGWGRFWSGYLTAHPPEGFVPQTWRVKLSEIKKTIEGRYPGLSSQKEDPALLKDSNTTKIKGKTKKRKSKGLGINRLASRDRANKVVAEIDKLLLGGKLERAKNYLEDIIKHQKSEGTESEYIAKTLCNVATIARERDYLAWSEGIYIRAQEEYPDDVITHSGLAETLKAQDKLIEAEELYRKTTTRWPNDVVAHNGLAETLKAQDKLIEAEELYRQTTTRWPNDVIAHTGFAETLKVQDKLIEAEELYRQTTIRWPDNVVAHNGLAETLKAQDKLLEAEELYRQNLTRWPNDPVVKHGLANVIRKLRRYGEALSFLPKAISFASQQKQYDSHLRCMILLEQGDVEGAKSIVMASLKYGFSQHQKKIFERTRVAIELKEKRFDAALEGLKTIPETPATKVLRLHAYAGANYTEDAVQLYKQLSSTDSKIPASVGNVKMKIEKGYFLKNAEGLKTPNDEEFDEVIRAEIDMLLAA